LVVYASESAALAYLETLAHFASEESVVELLQFEIEIPDAMIGTLTDLPKNWHARPPSPATQELGDGWLRNKTSVALKVPSVIVPRESNILINPLHPNFKLGWAKGPKPFPHDPRLTRKK
jgi:RES domain-containing protein